MATMRGNLVNKQFNSPIKLYSPMVVAETLEKQKQVLANGAVGIDFHGLAKPGNLANSAVLRMLEEEERSGRQQGRKRVAWPPPPEENNDNDIPAEFQEPVYSHGPQLGNQPEYSQQFQPIQNRGPSSPIKSVASPSPRPEKNVFSPQTVSPPNFHPVKFEPPRATVTLRPSPPLSHQAPPQVYAAQPVAATIKGGERMRGDQKWPPENVKQQAAAENEARVALAKGPACRPRKVKKDYSSFFAQHALNSTYPGYRAPPGTQHYAEGTSDL